MNKKILTVCKYTFMTFIAMLVLLPIFWMVMSSFRPHSEIFEYSTLSWHLFFPKDWTLSNYVAIFTDPRHPFGRYIKNTVFVAVTVTFFGLIVNSMAAFAFAKLRFRGKQLIFSIFLSALVIPAEVLLIPQYSLISNLGWINQFKALIVPQIIWVFGIFMLVQFFAELPRDIIDAARIDGANWFRVYFDIALPSAVPAMITLGIMTFLTQWDAFLWPLVIMDDKNQMIQVAIASYQSLKDISWGNILAATTICSVPIMIAFLFLQKYYVQGIMNSGVKG